MKHSASKACRSPSRSASRRVSGWAALGLALSSAGRLSAAEPGEQDASAELFRDGRDLLAAGRPAEACEKFRASLELRRSPGTLLNVGNCLEGEGELVAAREAFQEVLALAAHETDARKAAAWTAAARQELEALEPRVPRLTLQAPGDPSTRVTLDGEPLTRFGEPLPLDPGRHRLVASAPGKRTFERDVELAAGQALALELPELEALPAPAEPPLLPSKLADDVRVRPFPAAPAEPADEGPSRVLPWSLIAAGGAVFVGGAVTGLVAAEMTSDLKRDCPGKVCDDLSARNRAFRTAVVADVLMVTGLASAAAGTVWLLMTDDDDGEARVSASCGPSSCGAAVSGRF